MCVYVHACLLLYPRAHVFKDTSTLDNRRGGVSPSHRRACVRLARITHWHDNEEEEEEEEEGKKTTL